MKFLWVIKLLDFLHDKILHPIFDDKEGILAEKKNIKEEKPKKKKNKKGSK